MAAVPKTEPSRLALVVVTDPVTLRICREALGDAGFVISGSAESGAAAVIRAREQHPDVIILSQQLSDVPAPEAVKWLRSNRESVNTPIIILGGKPERGSGKAQLFVLPRPVTRDQLQHTLLEVLDH